MENRRQDDTQSERTTRLEVMVEHLVELIEAHMKREEEERAEILNKITEVAKSHKELSEAHNIFKGEYNKQKMFIAGIVAAVSTMWVVAFGLFEAAKFFWGK
jgi:chromosome segregation ATPase